MTSIDFEPLPGEPLSTYANRLLTFTMGCMQCDHVFSGTHGDTATLFRSHRTEPGKTDHQPWREVTCKCGWESGSEYRDHLIVVVTTFERHLSQHAGLIP